jgi:AraC-like DNA-binding protein
MTTNSSPIISETDKNQENRTDVKAPIPFKPRFIEAAVWKRANYYSCIQKTLQYLAGSYNNPIRLSKVAAVACMEKTTFSRTFRQKTGITLHTFIQAYRISQAVNRMEASDCSITEIAFETGFNSLDTFERTFKKIAGITPSQYRLEIRRRNGLLAEMPMTAASKPNSAENSPISRERAVITRT